MNNLLTVVPQACDNYTYVYISGWLFDMMGHYDKPYYIVTCVQLLGGAVLLAITMYNRSQASNAGAVLEVE